MIERILIPMLLLIILPEVFLWWRLPHKEHRRRIPLSLTMSFFASVAMMGYTVFLALQPGFAPSNKLLLFAYLVLVGFFVVPKCIYVVCSMIGWGVKHMVKGRYNWGNLVGVIFVLLLWIVAYMGFFPGTSQLVVKHIDYSSPDIPSQFEGYTVTLFADAHVGTYDKTDNGFLRKTVDSINAQHSDAIIFAGDLMNVEPTEIYPHIELLSTLKARDGVFSVLGNHDYAEYIEADEAIKTANCREVVKLQKSMGWTLLNNSHRSIVRDGDSIIIAGTENWGDLARSPKRGDVRKAVEGVDSSRFILMITHDPVAWREKVIPGTHAQLTLSGHTHGAQFSLLGWSPLSLLGREWGGFYTEGDSTGRQRTLYVTTGVGALVPFRFNMPGEIVVLTLHKTEKQ